MTTETQNAERETPNAERKTRNAKRRSVLRSAFSVLSSAFLFASGCKSPFERTRDASGGGPTGAFSGNVAYVIFSGELSSGGGAFEYPGSDGQSLSFNDMSNPISRRSIRYSWTGHPVTNADCPAQNPANFAGFDLIHSISRDGYAAQGRDLQAAGYSSVTFFARGSLSTNTVLKIEVASPGSPSDACAAVNSPCITLSTDGTGDACSPNTPNPLALAPGVLSSSWQQYRITFPNSQLANIRDFFKATFVFTPAFGSPSGQGGTAFFDKIQYEP